MRHVTYQNKKADRLGSLIFILVGSIFIVISLLLINSNNKFAENATPVTGIIEDIYSYRDSDGDKHHDVTVYFELEDQVIHTDLNYYSSNMREGDTIELLYSNSNPYDVKAPNEKYFLLIFTVMGSISVLTGIKIELPSKSKRRTVVDYYGDEYTLR